MAGKSFKGSVKHASKSNSSSAWQSRCLTLVGVPEYMSWETEARVTPASHTGLATGELTPLSAASHLEWGGGCGHESHLPSPAHTAVTPDPAHSAQGELPQWTRRPAQSRIVSSRAGRCRAQRQSPACSHRQAVLSRCSSTKPTVSEPPLPGAPTPPRPLLAPASSLPSLRGLRALRVL